jgi:hypothetical protein
MKIIGISGQMRNGKNVIADRLAEKLGWKHAAFAASVKQIFCDAFDVNLDFVEEWKIKSEPPPGFKMTVRQGLQFIGDGFRKIQGNIWIDIAFRNMQDETIINDVRYMNELKRVQEEGGINILVYRPDFLNNDPNDSEAEIRPFVEYFLQEGIEGVYQPENWLEGWTDPGYHGTMGDPSQVPCMHGGTRPDVEYVDVFIKNDGTLEDLNSKVDEIVLPLVHETFSSNAIASA